MLDGSRLYTPPTTRELAVAKDLSGLVSRNPVASTNDALQHYFSDSSRREISGILRTTIAKDGYPFMKLVALGAALDLDKTPKLSQEATRYAFNFMKSLEQNTPTHDAVEAFRFALVTLANMPDMVALKYPSDGSVLKRNAVKPAPQTTMELLGRLAEIQGVLRELYWGMIPRDFDGQTKASENQERILRTLLFFETGAELKLKRQDLDREELQQLALDMKGRSGQQVSDAAERKAFENLLGDLDLGNL